MLKIKKYKKGGTIEYTNSVKQPIAPTVSQNPTTPGKLDPQEQAAIQRRLDELETSQQMYQKPTDYRTPAEKRYYEQKRITELKKEGLTPEGYPTGRTRVNKTLDPVAGLIEKGIDASVVYEAGLLGAKGLRTLAKKVGSKISIPRGYTGHSMTDIVPFEPVYPTRPYRPPGGRTFPVLPARTPTGMPTLVDVPELTKEQQILQSYGVNPRNTTTGTANSMVTPLSEYQYYGSSPTSNLVNNLTSGTKYHKDVPKLTGQDIEDLMNERLQKGYGIKKIPQKVSVKYEKGNPYSHLEEPEHTFRINVEGRGIGSIGLKRTKVADHNIPGVDHPIYEKVADYPYDFATNTKVIEGSGVSGEVNKSLTDVLQEQGRGHLYSSNKHTEQGFNRWENLVNKGKAERITEGQLHDYYDPFAEETVKTSNARYKLLQPVGIGAGIGVAAMSQDNNKQYGGTINSSKPTGVSTGSRPSAIPTPLQVNEAKQKTKNTLDKVRKVSAIGSLIPHPYVQYPSIAINSAIGAYDVYNDIKEGDYRQAVIDGVTSIPVPYINPGLSPVLLPLKQINKLKRFNSATTGLNTIGALDDWGLLTPTDSTNKQQYGGNIKTEDMKNPKGMYWNGTRYVKAKGSGTWADPDYYANGGPAKFWELPSPGRTPGAEGMVDYGSMYSLPNKGLFQKSTDSEWEGFGNPANLMNQPRQPQMQGVRPMQPMQKATVNKKSFYEADGEGDYSIDAVRSQYMNGGNIQVPYMAGQPKLSYGGVLGRQYNNPQYTHVTGLAKYGGVLGNQYNNPEYTHVTGLMKDGGIHIKPENKGKFTAWAQSHGMGVQEAASHVMANKEDYSSTIVKRANFARNFGGNKKEYGGYVKGSQHELEEHEIQELINKGYKVRYV